MSDDAPTNSNQAGTDTLTVRDNRTGQEYEIPITDGTIRAADLGQIRLAEDEPGLATYDPGFVNTASCRSAVTFIDGEKGILEYRGYPIEQLAEKSQLPRGRLPADPRRAARARTQYDTWVHEITYHTFVHENVKAFMQGFRYDAHPMGMLMASVGALSTFYPESRNIADAGQPAHADRPDDRQDADPRRLGVPARAGQAVRLPRQRARLHRELPLDAVQDERAEVRGRRAAGQGARRAVHPARRPRAELLDQRGPLGRLLPGRPLLRGRRRRRRALRPAARRRQRGRAADAAPDRLEGQHPDVHRGRRRTATSG